MPKFSQLEGELEVIADLVIGHDLVMVQNQPKLAADWFTHRMSATHTPAAAASKKQGPVRSGWEGFIPIIFPVTTDHPHLSVVQPHSPIRLGLGTGADWGGGAHTDPAPLVTHLTMRMPPLPDIQG